MGTIHIGLNAEFSRSSDKPFEWAVAKAAEMGYKYFEPMIHFGRELMSEAGYFHTADVRRLGLGMLGLTIVVALLVVPYWNLLSLPLVAP